MVYKTCQTDEHKNKNKITDNKLNDTVSSLIFLNNREQIQVNDCIRHDEKIKVCDV